MSRGRRFRPALVPTLATVLLIPLLVELGLWQWHKGQAKRELQQRIAALAAAPPVDMNALPTAQAHRRVKLRGRYEAERQFLLDNQEQGEQVGYHVLTPFHPDGGTARVLVDRGFVPLGRSRDVLPRVDAPGGVVEITGTLWAPPPVRPLPLGAEERGMVWEHVDMARFAASAPYPVQRVVVRLDAGAAGCYVCEWPRPADKVGMHLGYAVQWFGMAGVLAVFYLAACFRSETGPDGMPRRVAGIVREHCDEGGTTWKP